MLSRKFMYITTWKMRRNNEKKYVDKYICIIFLEKLGNFETFFTIYIYNNYFTYSLILPSSVINMYIHINLFNTYQHIKMQ